MTDIEFIRVLFKDTEMHDTFIKDLLDTLGLNGAIQTIAISKIADLSNEPTRVDDGAVSLTFNDRLKGLKQILETAEKNAFNNGVQAPKCWSSSLRNEKHCRPL